MDEAIVSRQMPKYKCHKEVWALKIKSIVGHADPAGVGSAVSAVITFEEEHYGPIPVTEEYVRKHNPQAGGYYVVYEGGYKSFSPADAFESGYTRI